MPQPGASRHVAKVLDKHGLKPDLEAVAAAVRALASGVVNRRRLSSSYSVGEIAKVRLADPSPVISPVSSRASASTKSS
jgi:hypothetical protein